MQEGESEQINYYVIEIKEGKRVQTVLKYFHTTTITVCD